MTIDTFCLNQIRLHKTKSRLSHILRRTKIIQLFTTLLVFYSVIFTIIIRSLKLLLDY